MSMEVIVNFFLSHGWLIFAAIVGAVAGWFVNRTKIRSEGGNLRRKFSIESFMWILIGAGVGLLFGVQLYERAEVSFFAAAGWHVLAKGGILISEKIMSITGNLSS